MSLGIHLNPLFAVVLEDELVTEILIPDHPVLQSEVHTLYLVRSDVYSSSRIWLDMGKSDNGEWRAYLENSWHEKRDIYTEHRIFNCEHAPAI